MKTYIYGSFAPFVPLRLKYFNRKETKGTKENGRINFEHLNPKSIFCEGYLKKYFRSI